MNDAPGQTKTALLILGSVRAGRLCPQIAAWVARIGQACTRLRYDTADLAHWPLPMDDEAAIPALGQPYASEFTQRWSAEIQRADAVIFLAPQYNWGCPAALKNAIDHLYHEWRDKPAAILTYGGHGGTRCAKQLRQAAVSLKMRIAPTTPNLELPEAVIREGAPLSPDRDFSTRRPHVERALAELAALAEGRESATVRLRRKWRDIRAAIV